MRKLLLGIVVATMLAACGGDDGILPPSYPMSDAHSTATAMIATAKADATGTAKANQATAVISKAQTQSASLLQGTWIPEGQLQQLVASQTASAQPTVRPPVTLTPTPWQPRSAPTRLPTLYLLFDKAKNSNAGTQPGYFLPQYTSEIIVNFDGNESVTGHLIHGDWVCVEQSGQFAWVNVDQLWIINHDALKQLAIRGLNCPDD